MATEPRICKLCAHPAGVVACVHVLYYTVVSAAGFFDRYYTRVSPHVIGQITQPDELVSGNAEVDTASRKPASGSPKAATSNSSDSTKAASSGASKRT